MELPKAIWTCGIYITGDSYPMVLGGCGKLSLESD